MNKIVSWNYNFHFNKFSSKSTEEEILKSTLQSLSITISITIILPIKMIASVYYISSLQFKIEISLWKEGLIPIGVIMVLNTCFTHIWKVLTLEISSEVNWIIILESKWFISDHFYSYSFLLIRLLSFMIWNIHNVIFWRINALFHFRKSYFTLYYFVLSLQWRVVALLSISGGQYVFLMV